jgi:hypothetical protein
MFFINKQITNFDIKGFFGATELYLDGNPLNEFNPTNLLPSTLITLSFLGCGLESFNPTLALPASLESIILINNNMTTSSWNSDTAWISLLPSGGTRTFDASGNINTVTGTATATALSSKGWTVTP